MSLSRAAPSDVVKAPPPVRSSGLDANFHQLKWIREDIDSVYNETRLQVELLKSQLGLLQTLHEELKDLKGSFKGLKVGQIKNLLEGIYEKNSNLELRHCEQSDELPAAARNIEAFVSASARGCVSSTHVKTFCDWVLTSHEHHPEDFSYGWINLLKDINRALYRALVVCFKYCDEDTIRWPDIQANPESDQTGVLASFHLSFRALVKAKSPEAYGRLPDLEDPRFRCFQAVQELVESIDHKDNIIERKKNLKQFLMPHRFQDEDSKLTSGKSFEDLFKYVPEEIKAAYKALPDEAGESPKVKFTRTIQALYQLGQVRQCAKAAIEEVNYAETQFPTRAPWTEQDNKAYWAKCRGITEPLLKIAQGDDLWLTRAKADKRPEVKALFQENLKYTSTGRDLLQLYVEEPAAEAVEPPAAEAASASSGTRAMD